MNADGNNLPVEERRKLHEEAEARRAAEIRDALLQTRMQRFARLKALDEALAGGAAGEKLEATVKKLAGR